MNLGPPANDHMSIPHDGTSCTGTETDSLRMCIVSGWLQHPRFSGKIHSVKQREAFLVHQPGSNPQPIELCANIGQVNLMQIWKWSRVCSLGNNQRAAWCGHFVIMLSPNRSHQTSDHPQMSTSQYLGLQDPPRIPETNYRFMLTN
jgi:hypothetical protein